MRNLWTEIRLCIRGLFRTPGFTIVAILALGVGIGASTAIFTIVYSLIWKPLSGVERPGELVSATLFQGQGFGYTMSLSSYRDYRGLTSVFSDTIGFYSDFVEMNSGGAPERLVPMIVTPNYFEMLGVKARYGRTFGGESAGGGNVVVLSYDYWKQRFGGQPSAIGSTVQLNGNAFTIIGIAPQEFHGTNGLFLPSLYLPLTGVDFLASNRSQELEKRQRTGPFAFVARLKPGVTVYQAQVAANTLASQLEKQFPDTQLGQRALVVPEPRARMEAAAVQYMPPVVTVFMTLVGLVLLVACANVANLLLARAASRQKEFTIRTALGAGRMTILRQCIVESLVLSVIGGGLALVLALWPIQALGTFRPATDLPLSFDFTMDYRVFGFTMLLAVSAGIISGVIPGLRVIRTNLANSLKEGGRVSNQSGSTQRFRDMLVAAQIAVCLVLLVSAGLFFRSTRNAARQDFGFDIKDRLVIATDTQLRHYDEARSRELYREWLDKVRATPGVISASIASFLPIGFGTGVREVMVEGAIPEPNKPAPFAFYNTVETGYFQTMGMPILKGRDFNENDTDKTPKVAIINEVMASKFWPGEDPLGRRFRTKLDAPAIEVIGVTRVVKFVLPAENPAAGFYLPFSQNYSSGMVLTVHTQGDPLRIASVVRSELQTLDPDMPVWDVRTMEAHILRGKMILFDIAANIVAGFGLIGITLAAIGLYGLMAFIVNQRTHEFGVRLALGATGGGLLRMVVRQAFVRAGIGIMIGLIAAYGVTRLLTNFLVGVSPTDLMTFSMVTAFLAMISVLAALVPALRATRVDPVIALRGE